MKKLLFSTFLFISLYIVAQEKLYFINDHGVKKAIQNSIDFFNKTDSISNETKNNIIFISYYFEELLSTENLSISYSTMTPMQYTELKIDGQFKNSDINKILFYNYSPEIILVIENGFKYFNRDEMSKLSAECPAIKEKLMNYEYFKFIKGNQYTADVVENYISLDKILGKYVPIRVNTFDLKTFFEVWYGLEVNQIPACQNSDKPILKRKFEQNGLRL